jgi:hypothetical protein
MPLILPDDTKHARIVHQLIGPCEHLQVRNVPSDWVLHSKGTRPKLTLSVEELWGPVMRRGTPLTKGSRGRIGDR